MSPILPYHIWTLETFLSGPSHTFDKDDLWSHQNGTKRFGRWGVVGCPTHPTKQR